jgi:hypothetical protein
MVFFLGPESAAAQGSWNPKRFNGDDSLSSQIRVPIFLL